MQQSNLEFVIPMTLSFALIFYLEYKRTHQPIFAIIAVVLIIVFLAYVVMVMLK